MATIKSYTDISQSQKLAEILPLESADMWYINGDVGKISIGEWENNSHDEDDIPAWSLSALLGVFPYYEINNNGVNIQLSVKGEALITEEGECLLDLIVNMIIHLNELKML
jgi:hypothetical protein